MSRTISVKETQAAYSVSLDKTQLTDEPIYVERDGKPWAVLVPIAQFEQLVALQKQYQVEVAKYSDDAAWCQEQLAHLRVERETYQRLLPELLRTYEGKFVAVKGNAVVDSDADENMLAQRMRERGYRPVYIEQVTQTQRVAELPSPEEIDGTL